MTFNNAFDSSFNMWYGTDFVSVFSGENTFLTGLKRQKGNKFCCDSFYTSFTCQDGNDFVTLLSHNCSHNQRQSKTIWVG